MKIIAQREQWASRLASEAHPDWQETHRGWKHSPTDSEVVEVGDDESGPFYELNHEGLTLEGQSDPMNFVRHAPEDLLRRFGF